jgi:hypothetical protein
MDYEQEAKRLGAEVMRLNALVTRLKVCGNCTRVAWDKDGFICRIRVDYLQKRQHAPYTADDYRVEADDFCHSEWPGMADFEWRAYWLPCGC